MLNIIEKTVKKGDYLYGVCRNHPRAVRFGYVLLHRLVAENELNRYLLPGEVVHHKDGNKKNNSADNLQVMTERDHAILHKTTGRKLTELICPNCLTNFKRFSNQIQTLYPCCSMRCRGIFNRNVQLGLLCKI